MSPRGRDTTGRPLDPQAEDGPAGRARGFGTGDRSALASGTRVTLKTAPVDAVDPLRGRYVTLSYEISSLPVAAALPSR